MTVPNIPDTDGIEYPMGRKLRAEPVHHQRTQHPDTLDSAFAVRGEGQFHEVPNGV